MNFDVLLHVEVELVPIKTPLRVLRVDGQVTWKLQSLGGSMKPGDTLHPRTSLYLEPGSFLTCDDGDGKLRTFSASSKSRVIGLVSDAEAAQLTNIEALLPDVEMGFRRLAKLATVDTNMAAAAMEGMVSRRSARSLLREFDRTSLTLLDANDRSRLRAIPIRWIDSSALLVASDQWTPAKVLAIIERTRLIPSLALIETEQFEELLRKIAKR